MKGRLPLLLILLIGVLTPLLSTALFYLWRPAQQVNAGEVLPPQPLAAVQWRAVDGAAFSPQQWRGDWVLAAASGGACDARCRRRLCQMRQLRLMLPGHYLRLRRAWLITDDAAPPAELWQETGCGELDNPQLQAAREDSLAGVQLLYAPPQTLPPSTASADYLYLIDPAGVWAMRFPPQLGIYDIRRDLRRLLRISKGRKRIGGGAGDKIAQ